MTDLFPADSSAVYKTLLESTKAIPWCIDWKTLQFTYVGPQIETLLGWTPASWASVEDWSQRMHPDDREWVVNFCVAQSQEGIDHEADYRALTKDGSYVWIRDVVHVVRKDGEVAALIGFMFDISERKKTEHQLIKLQKELEEMSFKDGLTGISNRRMFDSVLEHEWENARRSRKPLSLIMLDIDYFKQFNDHYGHIAGDDCLKKVARLLDNAATRNKDFLARFGGEEFALILPETEAAAAEKIAERCRLLITEQRITHEKSPADGILTISLGVGTTIPSTQNGAIDFIDEVDRKLYRAKELGRNRTVLTVP